MALVSAMRGSLVPRERVLVIGDSGRTDIGVNGFDALFVTSGIHAQERPQPTPGVLKRLFGEIGFRSFTGGFFCLVEQSSLSFLWLFRQVSTVTRARCHLSDVAHRNWPESFQRHAKDENHCSHRLQEPSIASRTANHLAMLREMRYHLLGQENSGRSIPSQRSRPSGPRGSRRFVSGYGPMSSFLWYEDITKDACARSVDWRRDAVPRARRF
jgi:hypothetical protein